jgi:hypothetical protein
MLAIKGEWRQTFRTNRFRSKSPLCFLAGGGFCVRPRVVTPFGGLAVFMAYLQKTGLVEQVRRHLPIQWNSPKMAFPMTVRVGAKRLAHTGLLRGGQALHALCSA